MQERNHLPKAILVQSAPKLAQQADGLFRVSLVNLHVRLGGCDRRAQRQRGAGSSVLGSIGQIQPEQSRHKRWYEEIKRGTVCFRVTEMTDGTLEVG